MLRGYSSNASANSNTPMNGNVSFTTSLIFLAMSIAPASVYAQELDAPANPLAIGEPFPVLSFPDIDDGRPRSITEFRGQKLILHIFASW